ncbi:MAG: HEAT repeat domain-containing protein, partial [Spirulina sp.]
LKAEPPARETPSEPPAIAKTPIPETLPPEPPAIAKTPIPETHPPEPPAIPETPPSPSPVIEPHPPLKTGEVSDLVQLLNNTYNPDPIVRREAALAIGNIVAEQKVRTEIARIIPILGQLSRDAEPSVRLAAVTALAQINDREVIPYLQRALKDTDSEAIAAASEALAKFKRHVPKPPKAMPKNAAAQREIE